MNNLPAVIEHQCKGNIEKFAIYAIALLLCLSKNRGSDAQAFNKVNKVLINSPCKFFNSKIVVYKQVNKNNLNVTNSLSKQERSTVS